MLKRAFDIGVSLLMLMGFALPGIFIALAIKFIMGRPVLYRQIRIGKGGRPFLLLKFRTMKVSNGGPVVTTEGDSRITALGQVLRRWKLDELPQFWNILRGDMSVIGPRPEAEKLIQYYTDEQRRLLEQTPGLASMSQLVYPHEPELLRGHDNPEELYRQQLMPKKLAVDLEYERRRNFLADLKLIAELMCFVVFGRSNRIDHSLRIDSDAATTANAQR